MANGPYAHIRQASVTPVWGSQPGQFLGQDVVVEAVDTPDVSAQIETLTIRTRVSPPLPNHPPAVELAALIRARDLLDAQIQAMQSP